MVPAVWFRYDLNPITVKYHETRPPIYNFLTTVCAIVEKSLIPAIVKVPPTMVHKVVKKW